MKHSHNYLSLFMTFCVVVFISNVAYAQRPTRSAINLGLSVKWANMNIGADSPEEYGNYYAWGETDTKRYYGIYSTYRHYDEKVYHKYTYKELIGTVPDYLYILLPEDDAASKAWGDRWRMPTADEMKELVEKCQWRYVIHNGTRGYWVKNKYHESDSIFMPLVGYRDYGTYRFRPGTEGRYWTSSLLDSDAVSNVESIEPNKMDSSVCLKISVSHIPSIDYIPRPVGCAIRPVLNEKPFSK
mgnify:FL=1